ncbi:FHA domain-containing protein [Nocardia carnea]|uniref:FHA domain-containing protein n=1 Tax=Nocardia carnea TaxID=37328 RepID=UPI002454161A|nr:FHA domain-containing protein [Nocardia carnea]
MQDQQVEVVPGPHAVARVAGAVVLVAHRGTGRPTAESPAVRALVALAELVHEAAARQPEGPGATIAREATRWVMTHADRSGPGSSVDFGILSAAGPDRVAIFLHGAVTAVVAGETTEYFHGRDAAFTVDRTAVTPSRAVALFVDDPAADDDTARPELPAARGIGRLVEGIAEAGGVIAWAPAVRRAAVSREPGRASGVVLDKAAGRRAGEQPQDSRAVREIPRVPSAEPEIVNAPVGATRGSEGIPRRPEEYGHAGSAVDSAVGAAQGGGVGPAPAAPTAGSAGREVMSGPGPAATSEDQAEVPAPERNPGSAAEGAAGTAGDPGPGSPPGSVAIPVGAAGDPASGLSQGAAADPLAVPAADPVPENAAQYSGSAAGGSAVGDPRGEQQAVSVPPGAVASSGFVERGPDEVGRSGKPGLIVGGPGAGDARAAMAESSAVAAGDPGSAEPRTATEGSVHPVEAGGPRKVRGPADGFGAGGPPATDPGGSAVAEEATDLAAGGSVRETATRGRNAGDSPVPRRDQDGGIPAAPTPPVDSVELSERATVTSSRDRDTGDRGPVSGVRPPDTDPHQAQTQISGRQPRRAGLPDEGIDETADSRPGRADSPRRPPPHPTPRMDMPLPQPGPARQARPEGGTPPLDAELRRRTEATAKGTALTVKVRGFKCARAHPTDPRSAFCSVCGMPVDQTQPLIEVMRPPLGILVLDDGSTYLLETDSVLGRDPEKSEPARRGLTPLQVIDNSGGMSRAHAELLLVEWDVTLVDRGSTNGTRIRAPGFREWVRVPPHQPVALVPGTEILIGNRMLRFESAAPPPFGS